MSEFVLTPAERALLAALDALAVRYLIVGMGAALLEGAHGTTQDLDLWLGRIDGTRIDEAARRVGGFYTQGFGMMPPAGLDSFDAEYAGAQEYVIDGLPVRVLPLERVIASKRAANRAKDAAQLPLLEAALAARSRGGEP